MSFVEAEFWDWRAEPTKHSLQRFRDRALPWGWDEGSAEPGHVSFDLLRRALRDLAIAEGFLVGYPPTWTRLVHDTPLYVVIGRFLCLPMAPHRRVAACWEPTTVVKEYEELTWAQALAERRVRLPVPPLAPPPLDPAQLQAARENISQQAWATFPDPSDPPGRPPLALGSAGRRARREWQAERERWRAGAAAQRAAYLAEQGSALEHLAADQRQAFARWQHELWPAYQRAWSAAYHQARSAGPPVPPRQA